MSGTSKHPTWRFRTKKGGYEWECPLEAYWEVDGDPMSDEYTREEITAEELLHRWADRYGSDSPNQLIPISWFVWSPEHNGFGPEYMPFQFHHGVPITEDFLTFFTWPVHTRTGEPLNWLTLPVVDKLWRRGQCDKGGFIQEATGWKPAILQPFVYLPSLLEAAGR
jgi:hypothetical protein